MENVCARKCEKYKTVSSKICITSFIILSLLITQETQFAQECQISSLCKRNLDD